MNRTNHRKREIGSLKLVHCWKSSLTWSARALKDLIQRCHIRYNKATPGISNEEIAFHMHFVHLGSQNALINNTYDTNIESKNYIWISCHLKGKYWNQNCLSLLSLPLAADTSLTSSIWQETFSGPLNPEQESLAPKVIAKYRYMIQITVSRARADKRNRCLFTNADQLPSSCLANCLLKDGDLRTGVDNMESRTMASTMSYVRLTASISTTCHNYQQSEKIQCTISTTIVVLVSYMDYTTLLDSIKNCIIWNVISLSWHTFSDEV